MSYHCVTILVCASQLWLALGIIAGISDFSSPTGLEDISVKDDEEAASFGSTSALQYLYDMIGKYVEEENLKRNSFSVKKTLPPERIMFLPDFSFDRETAEKPERSIRKRNNGKVKACFRMYQHNNNLRKQCLKKAL